MLWHSIGAILDWWNSHTNCHAVCLFACQSLRSCSCLHPCVSRCLSLVFLKLPVSKRPPHAEEDIKRDAQMSDETSRSMRLMESLLQKTFGTFTLRHLSSAQGQLSDQNVSSRGAGSHQKTAACYSPRVIVGYLCLCTDVCNKSTCDWSFTWWYYAIFFVGPTESGVQCCGYFNFVD